MKLDPNKDYPISTIVQQTWIVGARGKATRQHIYKLIESKRLKAKNVGIGSQLPAWNVSGKEIIKYNA